jgi:c-di-GMP-binding flagellar brake protein YcgR
MTEKNAFIEKRTYRRISETIPVKYRLIEDPRELISLPERKEEKTVQCKDISTGGLCVVTDQFVEVGSTLRLDISFPTIPHLISAYAEVVWADETGEGLKFLAIKEDDQNKIKNYIDRMS